MHKLSFSHSGLDMYRYFESFKFLVSPIAYQLKAKLSFNNIDAKFLGALGAPLARDEMADEFINVQTLFLTNQGGGALLLEYDIN